MRRRGRRSAVTNTNTDTQTTPGKTYISFPGVKGPVRSSQHSGWFVCESLQWGIGVGISSPNRRKKKGDSDATEKTEPRVRQKRDSSNPSVSEVVITKSLDSGSAHLCTNIIMKREYPQVEIDSIDADGFLQLNCKLHYVMVSGYSVSAGNDGRCSESLSLNFTCAQFTSASRIRQPMKGNLVKFKEDPGKDIEAIAHLGFAKTRDLLVRVFSYLDNTDLYYASMVCKKFYFAACDPILNVLEKHTMFYDLESIEPTRFDGEELEGNDEIDDD